MALDAGPARPLDTPLHARLVDRLREYLLTGGLPEIVKTYVRTRDLRQAQAGLSDLIVTLKDDFAKYKKRSPVLRLTEVFESLPFQAGAKFKYAGIGAECTTPPLKDALDLLVKAGIAHKICHSIARGPITPVSADRGELMQKTSAQSLAAEARQRSAQGLLRPERSHPSA